MSYDKNQAHYVTATVIVTMPLQTSFGLSEQYKECRFLIVKRADWEKAFPGKWTVPGGKLEVLDYALKGKDTQFHWYNILENLARKEVQEETGLSIKNIGYITSMVYIRSDGIPSLIISLHAESVDKDVKLCSALTEYRWVTLEEAKNYDLIEGIYEELKMLDDKLKSGKIDEWGART